MRQLYGSSDGTVRERLVKDGAAAPKHGVNVVHHSSGPMDACVMNHANLGTVIPRTTDRCLGNSSGPTTGLGIGRTNNPLFGGTNMRGTTPQSAKGSPLCMQQQSGPTGFHAKLQQGFFNPNGGPALVSSSTVQQARPIFGQQPTASSCDGNNKEKSSTSTCHAMEGVVITPNSTGNGASNVMQNAFLRRNTPPSLMLNTTGLHLQPNRRSSLTSSTMNGGTSPGINGTTTSGQPEGTTTIGTASNFFSQTPAKAASATSMCSKRQRAGDDATGETAVKYLYVTTPKAEGEHEVNFVRKPATPMGSGGLVSNYTSDIHMSHGSERTLPSSAGTKRTGVVGSPDTTTSGVMVNTPNREETGTFNKTPIISKDFFGHTRYQESRGDRPQQKSNSSSNMVHQFGKHQSSAGRPCNGINNTDVASNSHHQMRTMKSSPVTTTTTTGGAGFSFSRLVKGISNFWDPKRTSGTLGSTGRSEAGSTTSNNQQATTGGLVKIAQGQMQCPPRGGSRGLNEVNGVSVYDSQTPSTPNDETDGDLMQRRAEKSQKSSDTRSTTSSTTSSYTTPNGKKKGGSVVGGLLRNLRSPEKSKKGTPPRSSAHHHEADSGAGGPRGVSCTPGKSRDPEVSRSQQGRILPPFPEENSQGSRVSSNIRGQISSNSSQEKIVDSMIDQQSGTLLTSDSVTTGRGVEKNPPEMSSSPKHFHPQALNNAHNLARQHACEILLDNLAVEGLNSVQKFSGPTVKPRQQQGRVPLGDETNVMQVENDSPLKARDLQKDMIKAADQRNVMLILDWDDTLFPTTMLKQLLPQQYVATPDGVRRAPLREEFDWFLRCVLGPRVCQLLEHLMAAAASPSFKLSIITNAMPDWVQACVERYYPKRVQELMAQVDVLSAREKYFTLKENPIRKVAPWMATDAADPLRWKVFTFAGWLGQAVREQGVQGGYHLIVVGDSPTDISAGHALKHIPNGPQSVTSVQFLQRPSARMLSLQLERFSADIDVILGLQFGVGFGMHLLVNDNLQNRRVAELYQLTSRDITMMPLCTEYNFPELFQKAQGCLPEQATEFNNESMQMVFSERLPVTNFQENRMCQLEHDEPYKFLYIVQAEEVAYAEAIQTIMISREQLLAAQQQQQRNMLV